MTLFTYFKQPRSLWAAFTLVCFCLLSNSASAWWNDTWPYRMGISVDASATGANLVETNQEVTVLLKFHTGNFEDFFLVKEDLADLRFIAGDDKTPLKHHVESFDLINQLMYVWVKLPQITGGINTERFWMYYGNAEAVSNADASGTYDVNTALVYHFNAGESIPSDVTAYGANASSYEGTINNTSLIGAGLTLTAGTPLVIPDIPTMAVAKENGTTISLWIKPAAGQQNATVFERKDATHALQLIVNDSEVTARLQTQTELFQTPPVAAIAADNWQHVTLVIAETEMKMAVNGNPVSSTPIQLTPFAGAWTIGSNADGSGSFVGDIDEFRVDNIARNSDWIKISAISQGPVNSLLKPQAGEQLGSGGGGSGLFTVLFTSIEESGWTVIMLLAMMAIISWFVMFGKMIYIGRVVKDNNNFLTSYRSLGSRDPALLDHEETTEDKELENSPITQAIFGSHDHFQSSPIYRLYHRAIQEVNGRMGKTVSARAASLTPQAVDAIKAAMDAQMIREAQRLNSKMVLLTIAISGGPFLGLLGTVLGVMITFAAIALTGDVNISAIAPGVAAALLTTVSGLIVAIPALFGYNYLASKIKESIADMRVFSDELITRLAEYHGA